VGAVGALEVRHGIEGDEPRHRATPHLNQLLRANGCIGSISPNKGRIKTAKSVCVSYSL
jgi:hypothetical protein